MPIKYLLVIGVASLFFGQVSTVEAGGAVAARQNAAAQQRQAQQQKIQIQRQQQIQMQQQIRMQQQLAVETVVDIPVVMEQAAAEASLEDVLASLEVGSQDWALIIDPQMKAVIVYEFIRRYQEQGIMIRKPPEHYVQQIDGMAMGSPEMLQMPFAKIIQVVAILDYDFANGQNPDALVQQILGSPQAVAQHKQRMGFQ